MTDDLRLPGLFNLLHGTFSPAGRTKYLQRYHQAVALQDEQYIWVRARDVVGPELQDIPHKIFTAADVDAMPDGDGPHPKISNLRESLKGTKGFENTDLVRFAPQTLDDAWRIIEARRAIQ